MFLRRLALIFAFLACLPRAEAAPCPGGDRACLLNQLNESISAIGETAWRDKALREYAKTLAFDGRMDEAISLIARIENPDTKAMTIRGIGMAASDIRLPAEQREALWSQLHAEAAKIGHDASHAIALTYIAMAQAFAGDDDAATRTASSMENSALRNKAFSESAEIQAERGDFATAMDSIGRIDSEPFRDKTFRIVSEVFAKRGAFGDAAATVDKIGNATLRAEAIQSILDKQKPRDVPKHNPPRPGEE
ncbi:MAG: hypothetical protein EOM26_03250 [Alphaproteobacteria bacterium]|nr:hypothetical protein [Alphaproteobacteria bacterium]